MTQPAPTPPPASSSARPPSGFARVVGYFVVFFASMVLLGVLFTLGGIGIILAPGRTPTALAVGYILLSIGGSVLVSLLLANRIFQVSPSAGQPAESKARPSLLGWIAGIAGTVLGGVLSAAFSALVLRYLGR